MHEGVQPLVGVYHLFFFSSRRRHTRFDCDWSSDVCSSDLIWIYRQRPDVNAIVHTHAPYASALAATGHRLRTIHMDSAMLHGCAHLPEWPGEIGRASCRERV